MVRFNRKIKGWLELSYSQASPEELSVFLEAYGYKPDNAGIISDACPTHLVLYTDNRYDFVFYPIGLDEKNRIVNDSDLENYIYITSSL